MEPTIIVAIIGAGALLTSPFVQELSKKVILSPSPNYENDGKIDSFVYYLRHKYGCQRLTIKAYHNGGVYYTGTSIDKFTIKHESVDAFTQPLMPVMQGTTTTMLKEMPGIIKKDGILLDFNLEKRTSKPAYIETLKQYGSESVIAFAVYKNVFKFNKLKSEKEMMYSIHLNWGKSEWIKNFTNRYSERVSLIQDIALLSDMLEKERIQTPEFLDTFNILCEEAKKQF